MPDITGAVAAKRSKAARYASEQDRFRLHSIRATMQSEHDERHIGFEDGSWSCTCTFFADHKTCSHVMALALILKEQAGLQLRDELE
ncbi:SWIM zinc finger family protein [Nonomuraea wenchangensis]|uniref:SWIM zinc finger family protein n=1 Tax=Nonomuraea wenchangensis TaxID=568860 RepID=UPI00331F47AE